MKRVLLAGLMACAAMTSAVTAQSVPGSGPADISADHSRIDGDVVIYWGDVNVVRGDIRLRADRLEAYITRGETGRREINRIVVEGNVFYVTPDEIARGDAGFYNLSEDVVELNGSVVLTQGCNVSTGEHLRAQLSSGTAQLDGGDSSTARVRSVFYTAGDAEEDAAAPVTCDVPEVPGDGPRPFPTDSEDGSR